MTQDRDFNTPAHGGGSRATVGEEKRMARENLEDWDMVWDRYFDTPTHGGSGRGRGGGGEIDGMGDSGGREMEKQEGKLITYGVGCGYALTVVKIKIEIWSFFPKRFGPI
jgi:hypothetical protein